MGRIEDKRDTERVQILGELRGEVTVFQPMAIKEVSRGGAQIETGVEVTGIVLTPDRKAVAGVETSRWRVAAGCIVAAAGAWSAEIGRMAGVRIDATIELCDDVRRPMM